MAGRQASPQSSGAGLRSIPKFASKEINFSLYFELVDFLYGVGTSSVEFTSCLLPEVTVLVQNFHYSIFGIIIAIRSEILSILIFGVFFPFLYSD